MPVTIKTGKLKYRKSNGTYDGFDAISNATTEEQVATINIAGHVQTSLVESAGATQITAIQNKGEEVLDSIPEDYSALSADVGDLKSAMTDITNNTVIVFESDENKYITTNGATVNPSSPATGSGYRYAVVPCSAGDQFTISATGGNTARPWCFADASNNVLMVASNGNAISKLLITAPVNTAKLIVNDKSGSQSYYGKFLNEKVNENKNNNEYTNRGYECITTDFAHGSIDNSGVATVTVNSNLHVGITPSMVSYDTDITVKCTSGYKFLVYLYDSEGTFITKTGDYVQSYNISANQKFRLLVSAYTAVTGVYIDTSVFKDNIYVSNNLLCRIKTLENNTDLLEGKIDNANNGYEMFDTTFVHGTFTDNLPVPSLNSYKYQAITPNLIHFTDATTIKANSGYQFLAYWYESDGTYISRNANFMHEFEMPAGRYFRLFVRLDPHDTTANVDVNVFSKNVCYLSTLGVLLQKPLTTLPAYVRNTLAYKPLGQLSKGYILLSCDDGTEGLATYTIPMLAEKEVPCTFGLLSTSAVITDETYLATLLGALEDGCCVAMHGSAQWPTLSESALNAYFDATEAVFTSAGITEVHGAICPGGAGADTSALVQAVAGGRYGSVFSGNRADKIAYGSYKSNGSRSNMYDLDRKSAIGFADAAAYQAAIDDAYDNHYILCPFWHDYTIVDNAGYKAIIEGMIDYAKTKGLTFITMADLPSIT